MLDSVKTSMRKILSNKKMLVIILLTVIFIIAAVVAYKTYAVPKINPEYVSNKEFITGDVKGQTADIYFFYT